MTIAAHATTFAGLPVQLYDPDGKQKSHQPCVYRVGQVDYDEKPTPFPELLDRFLTEHGGTELTALVTGAWNYDEMLEGAGGASNVVQALAANRGRMPNLRALFFGDITYEECEISWIHHGDVAALLPAFPKLEEFRIRGVGGLTFGKLQHSRLRSFAIESGGLPEALLQEVCTADLPNLGQLELWLGTADYGGIATPAPLEPLLSGQVFKQLKHLGLRNCAIADAVAQVAARSPLLERLEVLDLSLGALGDGGAEALLRSLAVRTLKKLDLHHHYISQPFQEQLKLLPLEVNLDDAKEVEFYTHGDTTEAYRYIVASE